MKIFIGLREIANIGATLAEAYKYLGHETYTLMMRKNRYYLDNEYNCVVADEVGSGKQGDGLLRKLITQGKRSWITNREFLRSLPTCDIFIFIFASSFIPYYFDYPILKFFGKKLVSIFCGSDIRYWYAYNQEFYSLGLGNAYQSRLDNPEELNLQNDFYSVKRRRVQAAEKYSDLILSQPIMAQLQSKPYMRLNIPVDTSRYEFNVPSRKSPIIVHAPSHQQIKGTKYILEAIKQLKSEGLDFEFKLIQDISNAQLRVILTDSDIVVDQLLGQTVATLALEGMATGNVVLARYLPERVGISGDCPVVNVTSTSLVNRLRDVIQNLELRNRIAFAGRPYVEKYHDHIQVAQDIVNWLKPNGIQEYDFTPTFYRNNFRMSPELLSIERRMIWRRRFDRIRMVLPEPFTSKKK